MKKIVSVLLIAILIFIGSMQFIAVSTIKSKSLHLISNIQSTYDIKVDANKIRISKFPSLLLIIDDLKLGEDIDVKNLTVKFDLFDALMGKMTIDDINIDNCLVAKLHTFYNIVFDSMKDNVIENIKIKVDSLQIKENKHVFTNLLLDYDNKNLKLTFDNVLSESKLPTTHIVINASDIFKDINGTIVISSKALNGNINFAEKNKILQGAVDIKTDNINVLANILPDNTLWSIFQNASGKFECKGNIHADNKSYAIKNIKVNGDSIVGDIDYKHYYAGLNELNVNLSKLHLSNDFIYDFTRAKAKYFTKNITSNYTGSFGVAELQIGKEKFSNINLIFDEHYNLSTFADINIASGGKILLPIASDDSNQAQRVTLIHDSLYKFASNMGITLNKKLHNIPFKLSGVMHFNDSQNWTFALSDYELELQSDITNNKKERVNGDLQINFDKKLFIPDIDMSLNNTALNINTTSIPFIYDGIKYIYKILTSTHNKDYLSLYIPLRNSKFNIALTSKIDTFTLNNQSLNDVNLHLLYKDSKLSFDNIAFKYGDNDDEKFSVKLDIHSNKLIPEVILTASSGVLNFKGHSYTDIHQLLQSFCANFDFQKINLSFNSDGVDINFKDNTKLQNAKWILQNAPDYLILNFLSFDVDQLSLKINGVINTAPFAYKLGYAIDSLSIDNFPSIKAVAPINSGVISVAGQIITQGNNMDELLYNMKSNGTFIAKDIAVSSYNIDAFVTKISDKDYDVANFDADTALAFEAGPTKLSNANGSYSFNTGILSLNNLNASTDYTSSITFISWDLYKMLLNMHTKVSFSGKKYGGYVPINMSMTISGPLDHLTKTLAFESNSDSKALADSNTAKKSGNFSRNMFLNMPSKFKK